jgi:hypothetical protein
MTLHHVMEMIIQETNIQLFPLLGVWVSEWSQAALYLELLTRLVAECDFLISINQISRWGGSQLSIYITLHLLRCTISSHNVELAYNKGCQQAKPAS